MSDIKSLARLSHEGVMGAGLARESDGSWKAKCRAVVFSVYFEHIILLIIFVNTVSMMVKGPQKPGEIGIASNTNFSVLDFIDICVTVVFTLEALLKIWLGGIANYLADNYSRFDFASVCALSSKLHPIPQKIAIRSISCVF
jgi:hypothetical protein